MIYTVTCNPSIDYIVSVADFHEGKINRTEQELVYPGGKGINVSLILKELGIDSTLLGFIAGFTGTEIERCIKEYGCNCEFIRLNSGMSRINVKMSGNPSTEINARGPYISKRDLETLYSQLDKLIAGDILVLAGAVPPSLPDYIYEEILGNLRNRNIKFVVDATGQLLYNTLKYKPFLVKPNRTELEELFSTKLVFQEDIIRYAKKMRALGAENVLVSLAAEGAILVTENDTVLISGVPSGNCVNPVGSGDSMVAGFLYGYVTTGDYQEAFYYSIAAGSASAYSESLAKKEDILALKNRLPQL